MLPRGARRFGGSEAGTIPGRFIQPPAKAEMMYDAAVRGQSNGARVVITRPAGE